MIEFDATHQIEEAAPGFFVSHSFLPVIGLSSLSAVLIPSNLSLSEFTTYYQERTTWPGLLGVTSVNQSSLSIPVLSLLYSLTFRKFLLSGSIILDLWFSIGFRSFKLTFSCREYPLVPISLLSAGLTLKSYPIILQTDKMEPLSLCSQLLPFTTKLVVFFPLGLEYGNVDIKV